MTKTMDKSASATANARIVLRLAVRPFAIPTTDTIPVVLLDGTPRARLAISLACLRATCWTVVHLEDTINGRNK